MQPTICSQQYDDLSSNVMLSSQSKSEGFASSSYVAPSGDSNSRSSISSSPSPPRCDNIERFDVQTSRSRRPLFKLTFDNDTGNSWDTEECDYQRKLDPSYGNVHNFYSSLELPQLRARSDSPVSSSAFVERDVTQRGRRSVRPTRLPVLMTRSASAANRISSRHLEGSCIRSFSASSGVMVMHGSHERLADDSEDTPFNVSRKLLDRCLCSKMPSVRRYTKRSLLTPLTRRPREWTYGGMMMRIPRKTFSVHDVGRIGSAELSGQCCTPNTMIRSCFADCGDDGLHYLPDDSFALQCASIAHQIQARFAENPSLHSTSSSRSVSPRKKSTTGQLLPRRCYGYSCWMGATRYSLYSSDSGVSEESLDELGQANSAGWNTGYGRNAGGGIISPPVERLVALWRSGVARCHLCRNECRLRRILVKKGNTKVIKPLVVRRDWCVCIRDTTSKFTFFRKRPSISELDFERQITLAYIVIAITFLLRVFELFLFEQ